MSNRIDWTRLVFWTVTFFLLLTFWLAVGLTIADQAGATPPNPEHKVTICHAHPADSLTGPWVSITVDVASVGYQHSGHQDEHDGDIIPPYEYTDAEGVVFSYPGKGDQAILANGCVAIEPSPTPTPSPTESPTPSPTPSEGCRPRCGHQPPPSINPTGTDLAHTGAPVGLLAGIMAALALGGLYLLRLGSRTKQ